MVEYDPIRDSIEKGDGMGWISSWNGEDDCGRGSCASIVKTAMYPRVPSSLPRRIRRLDRLSLADPPAFAVHRHRVSRVGCDFGCGLTGCWRWQMVHGLRAVFGIVGRVDGAGPVRATSGLRPSPALHGDVFGLDRVNAVLRHQGQSRSSPPPPDGAWKGQRGSGTPKQGSRPASKPARCGREAWTR